MRYLLELSYVGTNYFGWQRQKNLPTIQGELDKALTIFFRQDLTTIGCGRTDTGVHAINFFAHFDININIENPNRILYNLNAILPTEIAIKNINSVQDDFHARYSAISRTYHYLIIKNKNPFFINRAWQMSKPLNIDNIKKLLPSLIGIKDFSAFAKKMPISNYNCNIHEIIVKEHKDFIIFSITANRFLRQMVRSIVGVLTSIGLGDIDEKTFNDLLIKKDKNKIKLIAPPQGLYLTHVCYPENLTHIVK
jgi:tRNA pseudouridine38-40 synthase